MCAAICAWSAQCNNASWNRAHSLRFNSRLLHSFTWNLCETPPTGPIIYFVLKWLQWTTMAVVYNELSLTTNDRIIDVVNQVSHYIRVNHKLWFQYRAGTIKITFFLHRVLLKFSKTITNKVQCIYLDITQEIPYTTHIRTHVNQLLWNGVFGSASTFKEISFFERNLRNFGCLKEFFKEF